MSDISDAGAGELLRTYQHGQAPFLGVEKSCTVGQV